LRNFTFDKLELKVLVNCEIALKHKREKIDLKEDRPCALNEKRENEHDHKFD
jgi:hypothetical protein